MFIVFLVMYWPNILQYTYGLYRTITMFNRIRMAISNYVYANGTDFEYTAVQLI